MKRKLKIVTAVVLASSIAIGTAAYAKHEFKDPERRASMIIDYVTEELDLNATQEQALVALKDEVLDARELMQKQMSPTKSELGELMAADSFDQARALEIITAKTIAVNEAAPSVIAAVGYFLDGLDSEQKAKIREFKENKAKRGHRHDHH